MPSIQRLFALAGLGVVLAGCATEHELRPLQSLPSTATLGRAADPDHFVFYVFGDNRPAKKSDPPTPTIQQIADALTAAKPALAFSCGDLIAGKEPDNRSKMVAEYQAVLDILRAPGVPVYNAPGNHEMDDANDVPNSTMTQYYAEIVGLPYGSFDYGNSHFVSLNTEEVASLLVLKSPRAPLDGDSSATLDPGYVSPEQRQWLDEDLALHKSATHVFLFMHHSIHSFKVKNALDKASADALTAILAKYPNVTAVFSAHEHLYYNVQSPDDLSDPMAGTATGPRYLVTGGAGAPLQSNDHGFFHYFIVSVNGGDVSVSMVKL